MTAMKKHRRSKATTAKACAHRLMASAFYAGRDKVEERNAFEKFLDNKAKNKDVIWAARRFLLDPPESWDLEGHPSKRKSLLLLCCVFDADLKNVDVGNSTTDTTDQRHRDMARIQALHRLEYECFTVSLNSLDRSSSSQRHLNVNFASTDFVDALKERFSSHIPFYQISMDHVWCMNAHSDGLWSSPFFSKTLPDLSDCLEAGSSIFVPCCPASFFQVFASKDVLEARYNISFLTHGELIQESPFYKATEVDIDIEKFGKTKNWASNYSFAPRHLHQYHSPSIVDMRAAQDWAKTVRVDNKRMIRLRRKERSATT